MVALALVALDAPPAELAGGPTRRTALLTFRPEPRVADTTPAEEVEDEPPLTREERDPAEDVLVEPMEVAEPDAAPAPLPPPDSADPRRFEGAPAAEVARRAGAANRDLGPVERATEPKPAPEAPEVEPLPAEPPVEPPEETAPESAPPADVAAVPSEVEGHCPRPAYPPRAARLGWSGTVVLHIDVADDGTVADVRVAESSGHGILDEAALRAVRRWRFTPARRAGVAVPMTVRKPIEFRPDPED